MSSASFFVSNNFDRKRDVLFEMSFILSDLPKSLSSRASLGEMYFAIGLVYFQLCMGEIVLSNVDRLDTLVAARYFRKACALGKKEGFCMLGDISVWRGMLFPNRSSYLQRRRFQKRCRVKVWACNVL